MPSRYLAILDGRSRAADSGWQGITLGISINEDPIAFAQVRTRLMGILERGMTEQLGQPVLLHLKIFKVNNREPELLEQGESDFMLLDPFSYVAARKKVPGIIPIVRENADHRGTIVTRAGTGVTRLQDLRGKTFAFPAADDPLTIWAKARLAVTMQLRRENSESH